MYNVLVDMLGKMFVYSSINQYSPASFVSDTMLGTEDMGMNQP